MGRSGVRSGDEAARDGGSTGSTALLPRLLAFPARFAPPRHASNPRVALVIVTACSLNAGCLLFGFVYVAQGDYLVAGLTLGAGLVALGLIPALRFFSSLAPAVHVLAGILTALLATTEVLIGGPNPSNLVFLAVTPIAALFAGGKAAGLSWLLITWLVVGALLVAERLGWIPSCSADIANDALGIPVVIGMVFGFAYAFDRLQARLAGALEEARRRAEASSARRGDMLASMSHELRTPMNGVIGMTHALLQTPLSPEQRSMVETIDGCGRSLVDVISDILDVEQIDRGLVSAADDVIAPRVVAEAAARVLAPSAAQAGLELTVTVDDGVPAWVRGDGTRLRQILVNLVANAVKFTPAGLVRVRVTREGEQLVFRVRDDGPGVDPALIPRLFQPFATGATPSPRGKGSGLGLAISRKLAGVLGGTLELEERGPGAVFALRLPCVPAAAPAAPDMAAVFAHDGHYVLVVEDNLVNETVARAFLGSAGATCRVCRNGEEAIERAMHERFDVILMDLLMPGIDGAEVTRRLRALGCRTPIVAMTASVRPEDRARCLDAGMDDFLSKPLTLETVGHVLSRFAPSVGAAERSPAPALRDPQAP
ncbi:MAG: response regulator [Deltaproteobacteria bacterium]|nr:response regulator [Deltaproteobacteria bacterium]